MRLALHASLSALHAQVPILWLLLLLYLGLACVVDRVNLLARFEPVTVTKPLALRIAFSLYFPAGLLLRVAVITASYAQAEGWVLTPKVWVGLGLGLCAVLVRIADEVYVARLARRV